MADEILKLIHGFDSTYELKYNKFYIGMARNGGLGLIHANLTDKQQLSEVSRVKNSVHGLIQEPIKVSPQFGKLRTNHFPTRGNFAFCWPVDLGQGDSIWDWNAS